MNGRLNRFFIVTLIIFITFAALALAPVSAGGGITAGPWRDINPTQYSSAGDPALPGVPGPNVPFNGVYVRVAGFGAVGAGAAWAVGGCGPTTTSPTFPFSGSGCAATGSTPPGGGTITYYDGFSWTIVSNPFSADESFYTGVHFCTSPGTPSVGLCSPNSDGSDGWIVGGINTVSTSPVAGPGPVALYVTGPSSVTPDTTGLPTQAGSYLTSVFETCHVDNDPNGKGCPTGPGDAYAAGTDGLHHGVIYEYTGGAPATGGWHAMTIGAQLFSTSATIYNSIYMFIDSSGNLEGFAVGDNGVIATLFGGEWTDTSVGPSTTTFNGVAVDSSNPTDAWAVGYDTSISPFFGVIYHFSSGSWSGPLSPSPVDGVKLESVFLVSGSEGWIVGTASTILHGTGLPGSSFQSISTAGSNTLLSGTGSGIDLNSVSFQSSGAGWAVGTHGVILQTSDSSCGSIVQTSSPSACWGGQTSIEQTAQLNAVYENSPSDAWAGGLWDTVNGLPSLIHWDGYKWHRANIAISAATTPNPDIYGIYMVSSGEGYAVGGQCDQTLGGTFGTCSASSPPTCGVAYCPAAWTWNVITPNTWQAVNVAQCATSYSSQTGCEMTSVYFATIGPVDGWAVGTNGGIWTYSKASPGWAYAATGLPSGFYPNLNSVFINNPGSNNPAGWAVGDDGVVLYLSCSGSSCLWNVGSIPGLSPTVNLYGVYFANSNDGWIVGSENTIITTIDGGANWVLGSAANAPSTATWTSVHVDTYGTTAGSGDGWAVGCNVALTTPPSAPYAPTCSGNEVTAWWNGGGWMNLNLPESVAPGLGLYSVFTTSPTDGWAVGAQPTSATTPNPDLSGIFHLDPAIPPVVGQQTTNSSSTSSSSSVATTTTPASVTSSTSSSVSTMPVTTTSSPTVVSTSVSVSTMTVVSTPTTTSSSTTISVSTPMVLPAIPGFPWESIIAGIILGITVLAIVRRRKK